VGIYDQIFPSKRSPRLVQTEWASDWFDGAAGFGYAAEYLTEHRADFGATIDQAGLAVVFLQRHRVEMVLKGLLDAAGADVTDKHDLEYLWRLCERELQPKGRREWDQFAADHKELVEAIHRADPTSFAFRYPVDKAGSKVKRPDFIDLTELNEHVDRFYFAGTGYVDYLFETGGI
jgi:hypothetical protein